VPSSYSSPDDQFDGDGLFTFGRTLGAAAENDGWANKGAILTTPAAVVHRGDMQIATADASKINIGSGAIFTVFIGVLALNQSLAQSPRSPD
jgi:hypothetical protein